MSIINNETFWHLAFLILLMRSEDAEEFLIILAIIAAFKSVVHIFR